MGHSCGALLSDTLVGHSCGNSRGTQSCGTPLWHCLVKHSCETLYSHAFWGTLVGHSSYLRDTHSCGKLFWVLSCDTRGAPQTRYNRLNIPNLHQHAVPPVARICAKAWPHGVPDNGGRRQSSRSPATRQIYTSVLPSPNGAGSHKRAFH